jgi:hypothetical protein
MTPQQSPPLRDKNAIQVSAFLSLIRAVFGCIERRDKGRNLNGLF